MIIILFLSLFRQFPVEKCHNYLLLSDLSATETSHTIYTIYPRIHVVCASLFVVALLLNRFSPFVCCSIYLSERKMNNTFKNYDE